VRIRFPEAARILAAAAVLCAACFGFLGAGETALAVGKLVSSWQLFPATAGALRGAVEAISVSAGGAAGAAVAAFSIALPLLLLSAVLGRWYCAALCPFGSLQDLASWLGRRKRMHRKAAQAPRIIAAPVALALAILGAMSLASWLDPWSLLGRFLSYDIRPLILIFSRADVPVIGARAVGAAAAAMAAMLAMAFFRGRWFCNTLCPVGSFLGLLNRFAPFRLRMKDSACASCGSCASACPASCIDPSSKRIDDSRCVYCLACVGACPTEAVYYGRNKAAPAVRHAPAPQRAGMSRSRFLAALGGGAATLALAAGPGKAFAARLSPPAAATTPPGSRGLERYLGACTACGLCVSACPSKVLQPALGALGIRGLFVPRLDYGVSYCQHECAACLEACPSGALERMSLERKKLTKIGDASLVKDRCIVFTDKTKCGACAERCPTGAVRMIEAPTGIPEPFFTSSICIGCGACHYACPARPERAISVSGLALHRVADRPSKDLFGGARPKSEPPAGGSDFPF
jgi:polyferredoxin